MSCKVKKSESQKVAKLKQWLPVIIWMGVIFFLSSQPELPGIPGLDCINYNDKIKHFFGFGMLGALVWRSLGDKHSNRLRFLAAVVITTIYGMTDEYHQRFVPNRTCDALDLAADSLGAIVAAAIIWIGGIKLGRRKRSGKSL